MKFTTFSVLSCLLLAQVGCVSSPERPDAVRLAGEPNPRGGAGALMLAPLLLGQAGGTEYVTDAHTVWGDASVTDTAGQPASADLYEVAVSPSTVDISKTAGTPTKSLTATPADFVGKTVKVAPLFVGAAKDSTWNLYARAHRAGHPPGLWGPWSAPLVFQYQSLPMSAPGVRVELIIRVTGTP